MSNVCCHIMPSGARCRAYALRGSNLCYFHTNLSRIDKGHKSCRPVSLAPIEDLRGIQLALTQVLNLVNDPYADTRRVDQMLNILKLAARVARHSVPLPLQGPICSHCGHAADFPGEPLEFAPTEANELLPTETLSSSNSTVIESSELQTIELSNHSERPALTC